MTVVTASVSVATNTMVDTNPAVSARCRASHTRAGVGSWSTGEVTSARRARCSRLDRRGCCGGRGRRVGVLAEPALDRVEVDAHEDALGLGHQLPTRVAGAQEDDRPAAVAVDPRLEREVLVDGRGLAVADGQLRGHAPHAGLALGRAEQLV